MREPVVLVVLAILTSACPDRSVGQVDLDQSNEEKLVVPVRPKRDVDILFVVDNSNSMGAEQTSLRSNFPRFMTRLKAIPGGLPNVQIGVVSTDMGTGGYPACAGAGGGGALQHASTALSGAFIRDIDDGGGGRLTNYAGTLEDIFAAIANLGVGGCGFEQPLASMRKALDGSVAENAGFLRADAYLAVVFLTDEDDCSAGDARIFDLGDASLGWRGFRCTEYGVTCDGMDLPREPASYEFCGPRTGSYLDDPVGFGGWLKGLKADWRDVFVAAIAGDVAPFRVAEITTESGEPAVELGKSCGEVAGDRYSGAVPSVRMNAFLDEFPNRSTFTSICQTDLGPALDRIGMQLAVVLGSLCLQGAIATTDLDPAQPGLQLECAVSDVLDPDGDHQVETVLPRCEMADESTVAASSPMPCWWVREDPTECGTTPTSLVLEVERGGVEPPVGTYLVSRCLAE